MRTDKEDVSVQKARVKDARDDLARALDALERAAKDARKGRAPLDDVHTAHAHVARAEEALDTATYDLSTASGEDG